MTSSGPINVSKTPWPKFEEILSRLLFAGGWATAFGSAGWALHRNGYLDWFGTFAVVTISTLTRGLFVPKRDSWEDLSPGSIRGRLKEWAENRPLLSWFASPATVDVGSALVFAFVIASLESWVKTWFGVTASHPSTPVTLITLAVVLIPAYTLTGYFAAQREQAAEHQELHAIIHDTVKAQALKTPLGHAFLVAVLRTLLTITLRVVAVLIFPVIFDTDQMIWAFGIALALSFAYYDTISASISRTPNLIRKLRSLMDENTELKRQVEKLTDQVTSLRTQITVLQNPHVFTNRANQKCDDQRD
jgi:hypothetical protein